MGVEILPQDGWSRYLSNRYPSKSASTAEFAPSARCGDAQVSALQMNVGILVVVLLVWWCSAVPRLHRSHMRCGCTNASHPHPPPRKSLQMFGCTSSCMGEVLTCFYESGGLVATAFTLMRDILLPAPMYEWV